MTSPDLAPISRRLDQGPKGRVERPSLPDKPLLVETRSLRSALRAPVETTQRLIDEARRGSAPLRQARRFFFWPIHKFPTQRRAIPWEISLRNVEGHESGALQRALMGNGRR